LRQRALFRLHAAVQEKLTGDEIQRVAKPVQGDADYQPSGGASEAGGGTGDGGSGGDPQHCRAIVAAVAGGWRPS